MRSRYISSTLHLESTTALYGPGVARTGIIEGLIFSMLASSSLTFGLAGSAFAISAIAGAVSIGLSIGLNYLASSLFRPSAPRPEDVQQSVRQATAPRTRHYGRVKASGPWVFAEAKGGDFHKVIALGQGPIDAVEEVWIDDTKVTLNGAGWVTNGPWNEDGNANNARILLRLGQASETHYSDLTAVFPEWTAAHRGDGVASLYARQVASAQENYLQRWPNGINTNYRVVMRAAKLTPFGGGTPAWGDNAGAVIYDYMRHQDGMRLPASVLDTPLALAGWQAAYNRAQQAIALAAGGSEPRYRLWGSYQLAERPADVLGRMLQSCDGRLVPTPDGGLTLDIGTWSEPSVIIGPETIVGFSELGRGRDVLTTANTIRATYLEPKQDYQAADADPWADDADVSERGEIATDLQFHMAPSHGQARRLMKLGAYRANPAWVGTFQCNLRALAAIGERFVRIQYPLIGINSVFEVQDFRFNIGEGGIVTGVTLQVQSMPAASYDWDPSQEGTAPVMDETEVDDSLPVPPAPTVDFLTAPLRAALSFSPSPSPILFYRTRYKKTVDSTWTTSGNLDHDATSFTTGTLAADTSYDFQMAFVTEKGRLGTWGASATAITPA